LLEKLGQFENPVESPQLPKLRREPLRSGARSFRLGQRPERPPGAIGILRPIGKGEGRFEPRAVKLGRRGDGYVEVLDGINKGEEVVTAATFLIDAESNLSAAPQALTQPEAPK